MTLFRRCLPVLLALCGASLQAQETVNHANAAKVIPFNLLDYTPGSCDPGQVFVRKDQTPSQNLYICGKVNDWHLIGGDNSTNSGGYLFGFPFTYQGTPPDGTALIYSSAAHGWTTANVPIWKKYTVSYAALAAQKFTNAVDLFTLASRQKLCGLSIYVVTAFAGPTLTGMTVSIGDSLDASPNTYTGSVLQLASDTQHDYNVFGSIAPGNGIVQAHFTSSGAVLNNLTAGAVDIDVCTIQEP